MNKVRIGFSKPKKWKPFAWLIMKAYGIPYDHVYVRVHSDKYNRDLIYQASKMMVNFMGLDVFLADNEVVKEFEVDMSPEAITAMMQFAIDNAGKPYGTVEAVGLGIVRVAELLGFTIKNPLGDGGTTYVCSELAGFILKEFAGAQLSPDQDNWTPGYVYNFLVLNKNPVE